MQMSRRVFLETSAGMLAAAGTQAVSSAAEQAGPFVCIFSKHLQFLTDYKDLARTCRELGADGVDLTVRKGGHVTPENIATDLPRAVDAIRGEGLEVHMITTNLNTGSDPDARPILENASKLGIRYFRVGGLQYAKEGDPLDQLPAFTEGLRTLAELAQQHNMVAGYHNHSGHNYVGAPLWDLHLMLESIGLDSIGSNFDIGHATVEGGYGVWRINARMMASRVKMMAVKDFVWKDNKVVWVPFGQGMVNTAEFMSIFRAAGFAGPMSLHFEYEIPSDEAMIEEIRAAIARLRGILAESGYA